MMGEEAKKSSSEWESQGIGTAGTIDIRVIQEMCKELEESLESLKKDVLDLKNQVCGSKATPGRRHPGA